MTLTTQKLLQTVTQQNSSLQRPMQLLLELGTSMNLRCAVSCRGFTAAVSCRGVSTAVSCRVVTAAVSCKGVTAAVSCRGVTPPSQPYQLYSSYTQSHAFPVGLLHPMTCSFSDFQHNTSMISAGVSMHEIALIVLSYGSYGCHCKAHASCACNW